MTNQEIAEKIINYLGEKKVVRLEDIKELLTLIEDMSEIIKEGHREEMEFQKNSFTKYLNYIGNFSHAQHDSMINVTSCSHPVCFLLSESIKELA